MSRVSSLLLALDGAWEHRWESLWKALADLDPVEATWQAPAYGEEEREAGWPAPGTVHWHVAHLAHCKRHYTQFVHERGTGRRPPTPDRTPDADYAASEAELRAAHAELRDAIAALDDGDLDKTVGGGTVTLGEFLTSTTRHDAWHAGQIAVARRLWRTRDA